MNGPFIVAQANTASTAQDAQKKSVKVVKVTKPSDGQAITVELSHDQPIKIDLTAIAGENVTLTRIGERLIILFDNRSTVTIEPYLDSMNVAFEVSPGRVVGATEFLTLFSIATTDQSVSPPAGTPGAPASGADFSNTSVEPLGTPDRPEALGPLPLLSQGFVPPNWNANFADPMLLRDAVLNLGGAGSDTGGIDTGGIDTENPTVVVNIVDGTLNDGDTSSVVTFTFSEAPGASFTESDIVVSAGLTLVAGSLTMIDATHYEATVTAADGFTGNGTVSAAGGQLHRRGPQPGRRGLGLRLDRHREPDRHGRHRRSRAER